MKRPLIGLVTHEVTGGVGTMTRFLRRVIEESDRYDSEVILLATSAADTASVLARRPKTWLRGPRLIPESDRGLEYARVGAWFSEIEFFRYRPRHVLTEVLERYDILQFVAGSAQWVLTAGHVKAPKCLWVATTNAGDRASRAGEGSTVRRLWSASMRAIAERYEESALAAADSVFALSPYTLRSLQPKLGAKRASLAVCGVDTDLFRPARTTELPRPEPGYILCVGRLGDARKNIGMLLRSYASLARTVSPMPDLCLVGEPLSVPLNRLTFELGIADRVKTPGPRHGSDLAKLYREASFFVLSSDEEGLGIVILEAMASGLAVVSTASGGPSAIIVDGENGYLTPVGDEQALAQAMLKLIGDPQLRDQFGAAGRVIAEDRFSIAATGKVFLDHYERLRPSG
jgi:glycosyltransferase involved in cell wall biosynthesis